MLLRPAPTDLRVLATGLRFPEGPVAMPDGSVVLVEIAANRVTRVAPDGQKATVAEIDAGPNGAAIGPDGKLYLTCNGGFDWFDDPVHGLRPHGQAKSYTTGSIQRVDLATGAVERLYTACEGRPLKGPNDLVFDAHGGFYFTDLGKTRARDLDRGGVYYARADGSLIREVAFPTITANGCGLSPDGRTLYFVESDSARLWALDVTGPGEVDRLPWPSPAGARQLAQGGNPYRRYDSLAVDGSGNICVATLMYPGISVFNPAGELIEFVELPGDVYLTNICFGGRELQTAYVTLSGHGTLVSFRWPRPGLKLNYQDVS
jgi:gluconolactonase